MANTFNHNDKVVITDGGDVGIGTDSPAQKLHVEGGVIRATGGTNNAKYIQINVNDSWGYLTTTASKFYLDSELRVDTGLIGSYNEDLQLRTSGSTRVTISDTNGNVGIGTTSPSYTLDVKKDVDTWLAGVHNTGSDANAQALLVRSDATSAHDAAVLGVYADGGYKMIVRSTGNVGIGTTSPGAKLHVSGGGFDVYTDYSATNSAIGISSLKKTDGKNALVIGRYHSTNNSAAIRFDYVGDNNASNYLGIGFYANDDLLVVKPSGNVGIGTTSPGAKLDVNGVSRISGTYATTGQDPLLEFYNTDTSLGANQILGTIDFYQSDASGGGAGVVSRIRSINDSSFKGEASLTFHTGEANVSFQERMRINSAGNVGIGTTSPSYRLDVAGDARFYDSSVAGSGILIDTGVANLVKLRAGYPGDWAATSIQIQSSTTSGLDTGIYLESGGNVGIGNDSPTVYSGYKTLHIGNGSTGNIGLLKFGTGATADGPELYASGSSLRFNTDSTTNVLNLSGANVGIGTTSPSSILHISASSPILTISNTDTTIVDEQVIGQIDFKSLDSSTNMTAVFGSIRTEAEGTLDNGVNDGGKMVFSTFKQSTSLVDQMVIDGSGNVGIGTTSPGKKLEVREASGTESSIRIRQLSYNYWDLKSPASNTSFTIGDVGGEKMRITSDGNVGIGTTSPSTKLHVEGGASDDNIATFKTTGTGTSDYSEVHIKNNADQALVLGSIGSNYANASWAGARYVYAKAGDLMIKTTAANTNLRFYTAGSANERMRIDASGNVGIGTTSPSEKLTVDGNINFPFSTSGSATVGIQGSTTNPFATGAKELIIQGANAFTGANPTQAQAGGDVYIKGGYAIANTGLGAYAGNVSIEGGEVNGGGTTGAGKIFLKTAGQDRMIVDNAGNVGIGTTGPARKLSVVESGTQPPLYIQNTNDDGYSGAWLYSSAGTLVGHFGWANGTTSTLSDKMYFGTIANKDVVFTTNDTEKVRITAGGDVGIGTTSPIAKLDVAGEIRSTGGFTSDDGNFTRVVNPGGATYSSGSTAGAIKITLPLSWSNTMMRIVVKVFDYADSEGFTVELGGYNYTGSGGYWANTYAYITSSPSVDRNFNVRFGHDGTKCCIYIGETTQSWSYLKVAVTEAQFGHANFETYRWNDGWDVRETSSLGSISSTQSNTQISNWARSNQNLYYGSGSGNVGIGTTSPETKLHIQETSAGNAGGMLYLKNSTESAGTYTGIYFGTWGKKSGIFHKQGSYGGYGTGDLIFATNTTLDGTIVSPSDARMVITNPGNVGIGTTSPAYKLDVSGGAIAIRGNAAGNSLRFDDSDGTSRNAMYVDTSNYLSVGNANYAGIKMHHTATAPQANGLDGNQISEGYGTTENGKVLAEPNAWLAVRIGTTDYAIPMYTTD